MFGKRGDEAQTGQAGVPAAPPAAQPAAAHPAAAAPQQVPNLPPMQPAAAPQQVQPAPAAPAPAPQQAQPQAMPQQQPAPKKSSKSRSDDYYDIKTTIFNALIDAIDLTQLSQLDRDAARDEIRDIVNEIIALKDVVMSIAEQEELLEDICNDVLGYGPLEPLLARDDIADIMVNGADTTYIEVDGKMETTGIRFRDNQQLMNICQRIVSQVGRRVDEASPICDARLPDGSRVNVIAPPLSIDGPALTIRKFKKDRLRLSNLVDFKSITPEGAKILEIVGHVRCNTLISGGT
ncbi:unnamed protein product, partial [Discosporangium mesarthrocarpum]